MNYLHLRLGHSSDFNIKKMFKQGMIKFDPNITYDVVKNLSSTPCKWCELAKATRIPSLPTERDISNLAPMEVVCTDYIGKLQVGKKREHFIAIYVDLKTGYIAAYPLKNKALILGSVEQFLFEHVDKYNRTCKRIHSDYDKVYKSSMIKELLQKRGIHSTYSAPYHHQANGTAERSVRKLLDLARTMMIEANAPLCDTDHYITMAAWLLNRTANKKLDDMTPYEAVTGQKPDMSFCVPAGATGYALITDEEKPGRHKMDPRAMEVKLVGYPEEVDGSYLVKTKDGRIRVRRDVKFNDFSEKKLSEDEMKILYNEDNWKSYAFSIRDESQFPDDELNLEEYDLVEVVDAE
jgi:transposase InsO family protein